ncbi:MAG: hypothetical protein H6733_05840 [Alphaproteobacteria bacterium]|nr:hypothetical protein [Alphaproteobacteria bacterium]
MVRWMWVLALGVACSDGGTTDPPVVRKDAAESGPYGSKLIDTLEIDLGERSGGFPSRVPAWVVQPARFDGAAPVVLFHHDATLTRADYYTTATRLAARGMVVVMPQWDPAVGPRGVQGLVDDTTAAIDWLTDNALPIEDVVVDVSRLGVVGHGRGGVVALLTAAADARVEAAVALSPVDPVGAGLVGDGPSATTPGTFDGVGAALAQVGVGGAEPACVGAGAGYTAIFDALPDGATQWELPTGAHADLVDPCIAGEGGTWCTACPSSDDPDAIHDFARASTVAFLGLHLMDDGGYADWLDGDDPFDVVADAVITVKGQAARTAPVAEE